MAKASSKPESTGSTASRRQRLASFETARKREARRRTLILLLICVVLAGGLLAYPVYLLVKDSAARNATLADLGVSISAAGCDAIASNPATGNQEHVAEGSTVQYDRFPPDSGKHYDAPAPFTKRFYADSDRPPVETLVHNLEHGYTVVWYRDSAPAEEIDQLQAASRTFSAEEYDPADKFIAAPWTSSDPAGFPEGKNFVVTRWYADPADPANQTKQLGVRQACAAFSGQAVADFMATYPATSSPEPNAV